MVWPTLGSRKAKEQLETINIIDCNTINRNIDSISEDTKNHNLSFTDIELYALFSCPFKNVIRRLLQLQFTLSASNIMTD